MLWVSEDKYKSIECYYATKGGKQLCDRNSLGMCKKYISPHPQYHYLEHSENPKVGA